jgi:hypothetical protein
LTGFGATAEPGYGSPKDRSFPAQSSLLCAEREKWLVSTGDRGAWRFIPHPLADFKRFPHFVFVSYPEETATSGPFLEEHEAAALTVKLLRLGTEF